jgi:hypothetical protein
MGFSRLYPPGFRSVVASVIGQMPAVKMRSMFISSAPPE